MAAAAPARNNVPDPAEFAPVTTLSIGARFKNDLPALLVWLRR